MPSHFVSCEIPSNITVACLILPFLRRFYIQGSAMLPQGHCVYGETELELEVMETGGAVSDGVPENNVLTLVYPCGPGRVHMVLMVHRWCTDDVQICMSPVHHQHHHHMTQQKDVTASLRTCACLLGLLLYMYIARHYAYQEELFHLAVLVEGDSSTTAKKGKTLIGTRLCINLLFIAQCLIST